MGNVWRFTGPPENWITALSINKWALNDNNKGLWLNRIDKDDIVIFHSTKRSDYSNKTKSCLIGFGYVGEPLTIKDDFWWMQETRDSKNYWPYVVPFSEVYMFSDLDDIDLFTKIQEKDRDQLQREVISLTKGGLKIETLNQKAKKIDPSVPNFPVNGSASGINQLYEELIFDEVDEFKLVSGANGTNILESRLEEGIDAKLEGLSKEELLRQASSFDNSNDDSHKVRYGRLKVRKENQTQKRRVAKIEDYTCQICGFRCEYQDSKGKKRWIIHVDHIIDKAQGGNENLNNLWVLCPNCHAKKTSGVISIDLKKRKVFENKIEISIVDNHLF